MAQGQLPTELAFWITQLAAPLHGRVAWRFLPLMVGILFAQGKQTVASWLRAAGLVERARGGFAPTDAGLGFMGSLGYLLNASAFTLGVADGEGQTTVETLSLFRTMASIWLVMWTSDAENEAAVHLLEVSSAGALRAGRDLLVASPAA